MNSTWKEQEGFCPSKGRQDLKAELRGLLFDGIEAKYGSEPTEEQLKTALKDFGALALAFFVLFILAQVEMELDAATTGGISLRMLKPALPRYPGYTAQLLS